MEYYIKFYKKGKVMNRKLSTFYVTFGSDTAFPYPNGYMTIEAENEHHAREMFRAFFQNREGSNCLNFSFIYNEKDWIDKNDWIEKCVVDAQKSASIYMGDMGIYLIDKTHTEFKDILSLYQAGFDVVSKDLYEKFKDYREDVMSSKLYKRLREYQEDMVEPIDENMEESMEI